MIEEDIGRKLDIGNDLLRSIKKDTGILVEGQNDIKTILRSMDSTLQKIAKK